MPRVAGLLLVCAVLLCLSHLVMADAAADFIKVNGAPISQNAYLDRLEQVRVQTTKDGQKVSVPAGEYVIEQYITEMLITQLAEKEHVAPTPEQVDAKIEFAKRTSNGNIEDQLRNQGISQEEWRRQLTLQQAMINLITKGVNVSDVEARADYDLQMSKGSSPFKQPEAYSFSVITVKDKTKIDEAYKRLEAGKDFAELAKEMSEDSSTAPYGGKVGWISAAMTQVPEIIRINTFATPVGKYSKPVFLTDKQDKAWIIIKVSDKRPEQTQAFDEAKALLKEQIALKKADRKAFDKLLTDFTASAKIEISADRFKNIPEMLKKSATVDTSLAQPAASPAGK